MGIVSGILRDEYCWGTAFWKHANEDEEGVVDPVKRQIRVRVDALLLEHGNAAMGGRDVGLQLVVDILVRANVRYGVLERFWVGGYLDSIVTLAVPMGTLHSRQSSIQARITLFKAACHHDDAFHAVLESFISALLPIVC